jgi:hypothetical protein
VESGKYGQEQHDALSRGPPNNKTIPEGDHLLGHNVNHQGETRAKSILSKQTLHNQKQF